MYTVHVKGPGIAQCYEKPLWLACGDVDLILSDDNYKKAKSGLLPLAIDVENEYEEIKHIGMTMPGGFVVEFHGTLHSRLSKRVDEVNDESLNDVFLSGRVRIEEFFNSGGSKFKYSCLHRIMASFLCLHIYYIFLFERDRITTDM